MNDSGFQPRGHGNRGISHIIMLKSRLVGDRFCQPGDILEVFVSVTNGLNHLRHSDKRVHSSHAEKLIESGAARVYTPKQGERAISTEGETAALEVATDPGPAKAERSVTPRQKAGAL